VNANTAAGAGTTEVLAPPGPAHGEPEFPRCDSFELPAHGSSVSKARHHLAQCLIKWDIPEAQCDDASLILSELFTNALLHTDSSRITCRVLSAPYTLYLSVTDQGQGPTGPQIRQAERCQDRHDAENGRGLLLVSALARTWGVATNPGQGRTVWAVLNPRENSYPTT
jgi:anti-sigma regulatory factor (Ser/Thr protein kinase)